MPPPRWMAERTIVRRSKIEHAKPDESPAFFFRLELLVEDSGTTRNFPIGTLVGVALDSQQVFATKAQHHRNGQQNKEVKDREKHFAHDLSDAGEKAHCKTVERTENERGKNHENGTGKRHQNYYFERRQRDFSSPMGKQCQHKRDEAVQPDELPPLPRVVFEAHVSPGGFPV